MKIVKLPAAWKHTSALRAPVGSAHSGIVVHVAVGRTAGAIWRERSQMAAWRHRGDPSPICTEHSLSLILAGAVWLR